MKKYADIQSPFIREKLKEVGFSNRNYIKKLLTLRNKIINGPGEGFYAHIGYNLLKKWHWEEYLQLLKEISPEKYEKEIKKCGINPKNKTLKKRTRKKTELQKMSEAVIGPRLFCEYCGEHEVLSPCYSCLYLTKKGKKRHCRGCGECYLECDKYIVCKQFAKERALSEISKITIEQKTVADFDNYNLSQLPNEISQLVNITKLNLCNNQIMQLPNEIGLLTNLTKLYLSCNQIAQLPNEIGLLTNLIRLHLHGNRLTQLPSEIGLLKNLTALDLYNNQLTKLPEKIGLLKNLMELDLSENKLARLPNDIGMLVSLIILNLYDNQLTKLPKEIGQLANLIELNLSGNQLSRLPNEISQLTNLDKLHLQNNQLVRLPAKINQLKNLTKLNLRNNPLSQSTIQKLEKELPNCEIIF